MSWDDLKKELSKNAQITIKKIESLTDVQKKEVLQDVLNYYREEIKKPINDRKLFQDKYGGIVAIVRFLKQATLDKYETLRPKKNRWYGPSFPLFKDEKGDCTITIFFDDVFFDENEPNYDGFYKKLIEPEDKELYYILRGRDTEEYKWIEESNDKSIYARKEAKFIKEAQKRYKNDEIKSITEINIGDLDKIKHTFNANQILARF